MLSSEWVLTGREEAVGGAAAAIGAVVCGWGWAGYFCSCSYTVSKCVQRVQCLHWQGGKVAKWQLVSAANALQRSCTVLQS